MRALGDARGDAPRDLLLARVRRRRLLLRPRAGTPVDVLRDVGLRRVSSASMSRIAAPRSARSWLSRVPTRSFTDASALSGASSCSAISAGCAASSSASTTIRLMPLDSGARRGSLRSSARRRAGRQSAASPRRRSCLSREWRDRVTLPAAVRPGRATPGTRVPTSCERIADFPEPGRPVTTRVRASSGLFMNAVSTARTVARPEKYEPGLAVELDTARARTPMLPELFVGIARCVLAVPAGRQSDEARIRKEAPVFVGRRRRSPASRPRRPHNGVPHLRHDLLEIEVYGCCTDRVDSSSISAPISARASAPACASSRGRPALST